MSVRAMDAPHEDIPMADPTSAYTALDDLTLATLTWADFMLVHNEVYALDGVDYACIGDTGSGPWWVEVDELNSSALTEEARRDLAEADAAWDEDGGDRPSMVGWQEWCESWHGHKGDDIARCLDRAVQAGYSSEDVRLGVAEDPSTAPEVLAALAADADVDVRWAVAENPAAPAEALTELAGDVDCFPREAGAKH